MTKGDARGAGFPIAPGARPYTAQQAKRPGDLIPGWLRYGGTVGP